MYNQGQIKKMIVGLNFEDPANKDAVSTITFGYWDENSIKGGKDALEWSLDWYQNIGHDQWAVVVNSMSYDGKELHSRTGQLALIDSANTSIQIPQT